MCVATFKMVTHNEQYSDVISIENLFQVWSEFKKGKRKRKDVQIFERNLENNLFRLHYKLGDKSYNHGKYQAFFIHDPKLRHIHKASVEDRIVHHLLYKYLYELFDRHFIYDSYSCRLVKGTHRAVDRLEKFTRIVSKNYTRSCWVLKLDIKKFFASVNHQILKKLLRKRIKDPNILWLLNEIIDSFPIGMPLGNVTSQVFANIYMDELDQFIKLKLKIRYYLRYADDFTILLTCSNDTNHLIKEMELFLKENLKLELHPKKTILRKLDWGIDFLGYIVLYHYRLPRTRLRRRILKRVNISNLASYLGYLSHANSYRLRLSLFGRFLN